MLEKLLPIEQRYEEISLRLTDPATLSDNEQYRTLMKEYSSLTPLVEKIREFRQVSADLEEAASLLEGGGLEPEMRLTVMACVLCFGLLWAGLLWTRARQLSLNK